MSAATAHKPIVHFVGSIPLPDAETVFRTLASATGPHLKRLPDGETGVRKTWIRFLQQVLADNPAIEVASVDNAVVQVALATLRSIIGQHTLDLDDVLKEQDTIAHEFGHFTQGFGMRLSYVIGAVNNWFARVVYERDAWDLWLASLSEDSEDWRIMLVAGTARIAVGFSRLLLKLLMYLGHGVSCFLQRQKEYDADSYEINLAGSETFEITMRKIAVLSEVGATPGPFRAAPGELSAAFAALEETVAGEGEGRAWLLARARDSGFQASADRP